MLAAYNIRRSSVVLNPRGRVLGGLGNLGDEGAGSADTGSDGIGIGFGFGMGVAAFSGGSSAFSGGAETGGVDAGTGLAYGYSDASAAASAADMSAADIAAIESGLDQSAAVLAINAITEADAADRAQAELDADAANVAAMNAAVQSLAASAAMTAAAAKAATNTAISLGAKALGLPGIVAAGIVALIGVALASTTSASNAAASGNQAGVTTGLANANTALAEAGAAAGGDPVLTAQIGVMQNNINATQKAGINAAVRQLYLQFAGREPDIEGLNYWSSQFSPTITPDEVLVFVGTLYAREPNLRAKAMQTAQTAQPVNNLTLPLIAAIAGFLIFGG